MRRSLIYNTNVKILCAEEMVMMPLCWASPIQKIVYVDESVREDRMEVISLRKKSTALNASFTETKMLLDF